jgi:type IV pilus modification protein PilV
MRGVSTRRGACQARTKRAHGARRHAEVARRCVCSRHCLTLLHGAVERRENLVASEAMRGASLVEVLVALGVLSMGLLGIAQLLVHGMRTSHSALLRTQAVHLVADMAERIRANPLGAGAYHCAGYASGPVRRDCAAIDAVTAPASCTAAELAEDDLARWQDAVRAALPVPEMICAADVRYERGAVVDHFRVSLVWQDAGSSPVLNERADVVIVRPSLVVRR